MRKSPENLTDDILISWTIHDIKERDDQCLLSDNDCREILHGLCRNHDANIGINWDVIDEAIEQFLSEKND